MICPYCGVDDDRVIDSRATDGGGSIRRRRECVRCEKRFTTYERVEKTARLMVVKRDGDRVPFDPESILRGVQAACGKRPIAEDQKEALVRSVEDELHREFEREVPSTEVGRRVALKLRALDPIAYLRFASEYYEFRSLDEVLKEVEDLMSRPREVRGHPGLFGEGAG